MDPKTLCVAPFGRAFLLPAPQSVNLCLSAVRCAMLNRVR